MVPSFSPKANQWQNSLARHYWVATVEAGLRGLFMAFIWSYVWYRPWNWWNLVNVGECIPYSEFIPHGMFHETALAQRAGPKECDEWWSRRLMTPSSESSGCPNIQWLICVLPRMAIVLQTQMGMDQYLLIPFLGEWTSIYQLFWCSPGVQGFDTLPNIILLVVPSTCGCYPHNAWFDGWPFLEASVSSPWHC